MKRILALTSWLFLAHAYAQTPCGSWTALPDVTAASNGPEITGLATDPTRTELYASLFRTSFSLLDSELARWNGTTWATLATLPDTRVIGLEFVDVGSGGELYAFGSGASSGADDVWRWNGSSLVPLPPVGSIVTALAGFDSGSGTNLYAATELGVHRLQGTTWTRIGAIPASTTVHDLIVHDDGSGVALYAAGTFTAMEGVPTSRIARWNGTSWTAVGTFAGTSVRVRRLLSVRDAQGPALYALGRFSTADGTSANGVARWNGASWTGIGATLPGTVLTAENDGIAWHDDGSGRGPALIVSSTLDGAAPGFDPTPFCQSWNGMSWSPVPAPVPGFSFASGPVVSLDLTDTARRDLVTTWVAAPSHDVVARIEACDQTGRLFCFGDGSSTACPCGNASTPSARAGCTNSASLAGTLRASGNPSLSADSLRLDGSGMTDSFVLYFQATNPHAATTFGDGLSCTGGPFARLGSKANVSGASSYPQAGNVPIATQGNVFAPATRSYQARYRDVPTSCTFTGFNYTNAVEIVWTP